MDTNPTNTEPAFMALCPYTRPDARRTYREGWDANTNGTPRENNPYTAEGTGSGRLRAWDRGHQDADGFPIYRALERAQEEGVSP